MSLGAHLALTLCTGPQVAGTSHNLQHSAPRTAGELLSCVAGGWGWRLTDEGRGLDPQALELRLAAAEALAVRQEAQAHRHKVRLGHRATACLSHLRW